MMRTSLILVLLVSLSLGYSAQSNVQYQKISQLVERLEARVKVLESEINRVKTNPAKRFHRNHKEKPESGTCECKVTDKLIWGVWDSIVSKVKEAAKSVFDGLIKPVWDKINEVTQKAWGYIKESVFKPLIAKAKTMISSLIANGIGIGGPVPVLQNMGHMFVSADGQCVTRRDDGSLALESCPTEGNGKTVDFRLRGLDACHDTTFDVFSFGFAVKVCNAASDRSRPYFAMLEIGFSGHALARLEIHEKDGVKWQLTNPLNTGQPFCLDKEKFNSEYKDWKSILSAKLPLNIFPLFGIALEMKYDASGLHFQGKFDFEGILKGLGVGPFTLPLNPGFTKLPGGDASEVYAPGDGLLSGSCPTSFLTFNQSMSFH
jgi:hypothetical protein